MIKKSLFVIAPFAFACSMSFADEAPAPGVKPATDVIAAADVKPVSESKPATENSQNSRLRMFGQNGASAVLFKNSACVKSFWSGDGEKVSGGMGSAFGSFIGKVSNTSLGIAETDSTRYLSNHDGMLSKAYFREYVIPANKSTSMTMRFQDVSSFYRANGITYDHISASCGGSISFTPQAGADYEAAFTWSGKDCSLGVHQVVAKDGKIELIPVPVTVAPSC